MTIAPIQAAEVAPLLVDVNQTARLLGGLSTRKVWQLVSTGELPTVRIGRRVMFSMDDLRAFIEKSKTA